MKSVPIAPQQKSRRVWIASILAFAFALFFSSLELHRLNLVGTIAVAVVVGLTGVAISKIWKLKPIWIRATLEWLCCVAMFYSFGFFLAQKIDWSSGPFFATYLVAMTEYRRSKKPKPSFQMSPFLAKLWAVFRPEDKGNKADFRL
jgi:hypothetical protein